MKITSLNTQRKTLTFNNLFPIFQKQIYYLLNKKYRWINFVQKIIIKKSIQIDQTVFWKIRKTKTVTLLFIWPFRPSQHTRGPAAAAHLRAQTAWRSLPRAQAATWAWAGISFARLGLKLVQQILFAGSDRTAVRPFRSNKIPRPAPLPEP